MTIKINGTNTAANPSITGTDTDTGIVYGSDQIDFSIGGSSKLTLDPSGRLLLGTTTEGQSSADDLTIATTGNTGITIRSGTSNTGNLYFSDGTSSTAEFQGFIEYNHSGSYLRFGTAASERMRLLSGGGLTFNGDTAAANALDDYEEGTWTPSNPNGGYTFNNNNGYYTKIGNIVHWNLHSTISLVPNDNNVYEIHGLPYASKNVGNNYGWATQVTYAASSNNATVANMRALVEINNSYVYFHTVGLGTSARVSNSIFRTGMQGQTILLGGTYMAA